MSPGTYRSRERLAAPISLDCGGGEQEGGGSQAWHVCEALYATAYRLYVVYDGAHRQSQPPSSKKRGVASPKD